MRREHLAKRVELASSIRSLDDGLYTTKRLPNKSLTFLIAFLRGSKYVTTSYTLWGREGSVKGYWLKGCGP